MPNVRSDEIVVEAAINHGDLLSCLHMFQSSIVATSSQDSLDFVQALENLDLAAVQKVPKADLHNHGGLGMRFSRLCDIVPGLVPPPKSFSGLPGFLDWTTTIMRPLSRDRTLMPLLYRATIEDAIADGVSFLEMSFDLRVGIHYGKAVDYANLVAEICRPYQGRIEIRPELGFKKSDKAKINHSYIHELLDSGIFKSVDLYGAERHPWRLGQWRAVYRRAQALGIKCKAHFGEFEKPFGIAACAESLGIQAIQHGISLARSKRSLRWLAAEGIACNVCPASNIALGAVTDWRGHPIRRMFDAGVKVTVATDDLVAFDMSVSEQFLALRREGAFSAAELDQIRQNGLSEGSI